MKVHFIAIGGSIMHNLAIALKAKGYTVSGSDDEIYEPSFSALKSEGLLPEQMGWFPDRVTEDLDAVILGMHAREDNPELQKAKSLGLKVYSYPEYVYEQSKNKQRVVVAGSHGKTTVTAMIIHVLKAAGKNPDYLVGARLKGVERPVKLTEEAPVIVIEGDEYFTSPTDRRPKFLNYHHHFGVITGIAWDHVNVYPEYDTYEDQFRQFAELTPKAGLIAYSEDDKTLKKLIKQAQINEEDVKLFPYGAVKTKVKDGITYLKQTGEALKVFGEHNMQNINAAMIICSQLGVSEETFNQAITSFEGASLRLQLLAEKNGTKVFRDFAHAPSKVQATVQAFAKQFKGSKSVACLELHTFSSLNKDFIGQYKNTMKDADEAIVYFSPKTIEHKKLSPISVSEVENAFAHKNIKVFTDSEMLKQYLTQKDWNNHNLLIMTSGSFDGLNLIDLAEEVTK
ncbi:Mur ligase family protein [Limibacter armeniacum]|uniref:UDP-N-acetylmuramate--L-alanine ligase n=1 Tax=Limibacter armeniacum TaxID=466084 RepID=UPI002FE54898